MFNFKVEVQNSSNKEYGLGLFAKEFIEQDSVVWKFKDGIDIKIDKNTFDNLSKVHKDYFKKYGWKDNDYIYSSCDLTNFINHSFNPNLVCSGDLTIAQKDISIGEELFINYQEFDDWFEEYKHILK